MAAKASPTPDEMIEALEQDRARIMGKHALAGRALAEARAQLADTGETSIRARRYVSELAAAEGRTGELAEVLAKAEADAHAAIRENEPKAAALETAARNIAAKIDTIRDEHIEFYSRQAHALSVQAVEVQDTAREALAACYEAWKAADGGWGRVRSSRRRLRWPDVPSSPISDLGSLASGFERAVQVPPWPGGQRPARVEQLAPAWHPVDWPSRFEEGGR